jgi:hypothetical protein
MKTPKIDLRELQSIKEENHKDRIRFISRYAEWVKKNPNKKWSSEQRETVDQV